MSSERSESIWSGTSSVLDKIQFTRRLSTDSSQSSVTVTVTSSVSGINERRESQERAETSFTSISDDRCEPIVPNSANPTPNPEANDAQFHVSGTEWSCCCCKIKRFEYQAPNCNPCYCCGFSLLLTSLLSICYKKQNAED